jgi:uncharacterized protein
MRNIEIKIADELNINPRNVKAVLSLFEEGATVPFIARYRKERTGGLNEDQLREIEERFAYLTLLASRKETVLKSIEEQGKLTTKLKEKILAAEKLQEVEDLYLPYKPKRRTRAVIAKEKGLEPLAEFLLNNPNFKGDLLAKAGEFVNEEKGVKSAEEAIAGAKDIIAEAISETAEVRKKLRDEIRANGFLVSEKIEQKEERKDGKKDVYEIYHDFSAPFGKIKPYQTLAINRGEKEKFLKVSFDFDKAKAEKIIRKVFFGKAKSVFDEIFDETVSDAFSRLIFPSIERELRKELTEAAEEHAIEIFASNLKQLLLQPPISGKIIMGIDPGFVSGSKVAVIDKTGKYLEGVTIYPHPPQNKTAEAKRKIAELVEKYGVEVIAIGNGTASRETETLVAELLREEKLNAHYLIVNEAGASVYSASRTAKEEFPDLEASMRGNISIARRVLDPLSELVKIDPKSIGVGLYQHDVNQKRLSKKLDDVVVSCVNYVGVDLNTASVSLLTYVSGLNKAIAKRIVKYREENGRFETREELKNVSGLGEKAFEQCAGFLKIPGGKNPLDNTFIHPESYDATLKLLNAAGVSPEEIKEKGKSLELFVNKKGVEKIAAEIGLGVPTLIDIIENLKKPGRDPREDLPKPILKSDVLKLEDLSEGMKLKGTVRNIVDFGAFVDIGLKNDALLHISEMSNSFVKSPLDILSVGDVIDVTIKSIDFARGRVALTRRD